MSLLREGVLTLILCTLALGAAHALAQAAKRSNPATVRSCASAIAYTERWFPKGRFSCVVERGRYVVRALVCEGASCRLGALVAAFEVAQSR